MASISLSRDGDVAVVTLDNPPLNLFQEGSFGELRECLEEVERSDARALVWRSEGELFTGGVDVNDFKKVADAGPDRVGEFAEGLIKAVRRLEQLEIPTLALVHGLCLTAGLEVALGCDIIWAAESARFGLVEAVVGLSPGAGGTQRMAERAGPGRAREFVMSGALYEPVRGPVRHRGPAERHRLVPHRRPGQGYVQRSVTSAPDGARSRARVPAR